MKHVYICSPLRGNVQANMQHAQMLCREAIEHSVAPFAPHAFYTHFLDDDNQDERDAGISCGLSWLAKCDEIWVDQRRGISQGMQSEIAIAEKLGIKIVYPAWSTKIPDEQ